MKLTAVAIPALALILSGCTAEKEPTQVATFTETKAECKDSAVPNSYVVRWKDGTHTVYRGYTREDFKSEVFEPNQDDIASAEQDQTIQISPNAVFSKDASSSAAASDSWGQTITLAADAWAAGAKGSGVTVAVIDTGADITHPQLQTQLYTNTKEIPNNGLDDDGNGLIDDVHGWDFLDETPYVGDPAGHGTHVSGIILADHTKGAIQGIAPEAKLLPIRFLSKDGGGSIGDAILGIEYAVQQGAKVINASWGGPPCSSSLRKAITDLSGKGVLFVAAAGNSGSNIDIYPEYPAAFNLQNQITVGASTSRDYTADFSNYSYSLVHLFAPGAQILSTWPGNRTVSISGTSMATPFVAGAAALLMAAKPSATAAQIRAALVNSVDKGNFAAFSRGRLNIRHALEALQ